MEIGSPFSSALEGTATGQIISFAGALIHQIAAGKRVYDQFAQVQFGERGGQNVMFPPYPRMAA